MEARQLLCAVKPFNVAGNQQTNMFSWPGFYKQSSSLDAVEMKQLSVAVVQMNVTDCKDKNNACAERLIRAAVDEHNPQMVVLPELFNCPHGNRTLFERFAEVVPTGETCMLLARLAKELKVYLIAGSIAEREAMESTNLYNTTTVWSPTGEMIAKHRQLHLANMSVTNEFTLRETDFVTAGNTLTICQVHDVKIGLGICHDMCFGEMATLYRRMG